jgi:hypothetical protein
MAHLPTPEPKDQLEAILERALTAYHRDELHGGARWIAERALDTELVPVTREAFRDADDLPSDRKCCGPSSSRCGCSARDTTSSLSSSHSIGSS